MDAERRAEPDRAPGGEDVRRPGEVVARRLGGGRADEERAGGADAGEERLGSGDLQAHVLGGDRVGDLGEPGARQRDDRDAVSLHRGARDGRARERLERAADLEGDRLRERCGRADQERIRRLVVLRLGEEIRRHDVRVRRLVGDDEDLARPGDAVDRHRAEDEALGAGDVEVSRADDLVDPRDRLGPVGERADRVRPPGVEDRA